MSSLYESIFITWIILILQDNRTVILLLVFLQNLGEMTPVDADILQSDNLPLKTVHWKVCIYRVDVIVQDNVQHQTKRLVKIRF